jgi:tripartite-type tricarboxylate transporter receptor subunit TctC
VRDDHRYSKNGKIEPKTAIIIFERKTTMKLKTATFFFIALTLCVPRFAHAADDFPSKAIQIINPFAAGGSTDLTCRVLASVAPETFGQPLVVVTKAGAGGSIGAAFVARAKPDGYTLLMGSMATVVMRSLSEKLPYSAESFIPIGQVVLFKGVLLVQGTSPVKTIEDLIEEAKKRELKYGSAGVGTTGHLAVEAIAMAVPDKLNFLHIPYPGSADSQAALLGGHVDFILGDPAVAKGLVNEGKLRALAVVSSTKSSAFPDAPTLKERNIDVVFDVWRGVFAPAGTPEAIVAKLRDSFRNAATSPVFAAMISKMGEEYEFKSGPDFAKDVDQSVALMKKILAKLDMLVK